MLSFIKKKEFLVGVLIGLVAFYAYNTYGDALLGSEESEA